MPANAAPIDRRYGGDKIRLLTLDSLDGRTAAARRARDLVNGIEADLGGGDHLSVAERQLVQRAAVLGAIIESQEVAWLAGKEVDVAAHLASINAQRRVLSDLGLERRSRDVTPSLAEYLAASADKAAARRSAADVEPAE